jgi:hypothetical protein
MYVAKEQHKSASLNRLQSLSHEDSLMLCLCLNMSDTLERIDQHLLPSIFRFVAASFQAGPTGLGSLALAQALSMAIACPFVGVLGKSSTSAAAIWPCILSYHKLVCGLSC